MVVGAVSEAEEEGGDEEEDEAAEGGEERECGRRGRGGEVEGEEDGGRNTWIRRIQG